MLLAIILLGIGTFLLYQKSQPMKEKPKNEFQTIGYKEEELTRINTLTPEEKEVIKTVPYQENLLAILNNEAYKASNLKAYLSFSNQELAVDDLVYVVNHNFLTTTYDEITLKLMHQEYYIHARLSRYLEYQKSHPDLDVKEIITRINSDLDIPFYTNPENTDLTKGFLMIANKHYYLGNYIPEDLVTIDAKYGYQGKINATVYEEYKKLFDAAYQAGMRLTINSPYRSYQTQNTLYNNYSARDGKAAADTYSARPGYSEHQTGLAMDITSNRSNFDSFENTQEFTWMQEHAHEYGFILRYPKGKEYITGYIYEPWHYRYVGIEAATYIREHQITYEEYYAYFVK